MRDEQYTMGEDAEGYAGTQGGQYEDYGYAPQQQQQERGYADRRQAAERPTRQPREARSRSGAPARQNGAGAARNVLGNVAGAVTGAFGGLTSKIHDLSADRVRGKLDIEADDYLGVGAPCRMCGSPVDRLQVRCPHCGARTRPLHTQPTFWIGVAVLVLLVVVLSLAIGSCKSEQAANPGASTHVTATTAEALQTAVADAETTLADQASHVYTRLSAFKAQEAIDAAKDVATSSNATEQEISDASKNLLDAMSGLVRVVDTSSYEWPYATDFTANPDAYLGKQIAMTGTVSSVNVPADGSLGWSEITLNDGSTLGIGVYASDVQADLEVGKEVTVYGVLNSDGSSYAFWCDKVEVF